jgi:hypothetical protein
LLGTEGVAALSDARERIIIAKACGARTPLVAWAVLQPSFVITVSWSEDYGVFAAPVPARAGSPVDVEIMAFPARDRTTYRYRNQLFEPITPPEDGLPKKHYGVLNDSTDATAFGLLQHAIAGGEKSLLPVSFAVLSPGAPADLIPDEDVVVWSDMTTAAGTVVSAVPRNALVVPWLGRRWQCCCYEPNADAFAWIGGR